MEHCDMDLTKIGSNSGRKVKGNLSLLGKVEWNEDLSHGSKVLLLQITLKRKRKKELLSGFS
jgi:hypothetical protein